MPRTDLAAASNARMTQIVEYGTDPRGAAMFAALTGGLARVLGGAQRVVDTQRRFTGPAPTVQRFTGMAPLGMATTITPANSTIGDERAANPLNDTAQRIFAERLRRNR